MTITYVDKQFIDRCKKISEHVDPFIFINIYEQYQTNFLKDIKNSLGELSSKIHERSRNPDTLFYTSGRMKSKLSYYNKTFLKLVENIDRLFSNKLEESQKEALIDKYFKYLKDENNDEQYDTLHSLIVNLSKLKVNSFTAFNIICEKLSEQDLRIFLQKLGTTQDIFAFKFVVQDAIQTLSSGAIKSCTRSKNGTYKIDLVNSKSPIYISPSIKLDPSSDIITKNNGVKYVAINGKEFILNEQSLLYPDNITANNRQLENATKDKDGKVTLLRDYFILPSGDIVYIDKISRKSGKYFVHSNGDIRSLDALLSKVDIRLCKNDDDTLYDSSKNIETLMNTIFKQIGFDVIPTRRKDYFLNPKTSGYGNTIHNSYYNASTYYPVETQVAVQCIENNYHMRRKQ